MEVLTGDAVPDIDKKALLISLLSLAGAFIPTLFVNYGYIVILPSVVFGSIFGYFWFQAIKKYFTRSPDWGRRFLPTMIVFIVVVDYLLVSHLVQSIYLVGVLHQAYEDFSLQLSNFTAICTMAGQWKYVANVDIRKPVYPEDTTRLTVDGQEILCDWSFTQTGMVVRCPTKNAPYCCVDRTIRNCHIAPCNFYPEGSSWSRPAEIAWSCDKEECSDLDTSYSIPSALASSGSHEVKIQIGIDVAKAVVTCP